MQSIKTLVDGCVSGNLRFGGKRCGLVSYLRGCTALATALTIVVATLIFTSCKGNSQVAVVKSSEQMLKDYGLYYQTLKTKSKLTSENLILEFKDWRILKDSALAQFARDTIRPPHSDYEGRFQVIHDSIRYEMCRLTSERSRSFKDLLLIKESVSPYMDAGDLKGSVKECESFFNKLDQTPLRKGTLKSTISEYENFLQTTVKSGIKSKEAMLAFIQAEDVHFRRFLVHFNSLYDRPVGHINQLTEQCCKEVFTSANANSIPVQDALVYMTIRNNRRLMQNAKACMDDIKAGRINDKEQAQAYCWVMLQPYSTINEIGVAVLSQSDRIQLLKLADETPKLLDSLNKQLSIDVSRIARMAELLIKAYIYTI